jgi:hypothetical protein
VLAVSLTLEVHCLAPCLLQAPLWQQAPCRLPAAMTVRQAAPRQQAAQQQARTCLMPKVRRWAHRWLLEAPLQQPASLLPAAILQLQRQAEQQAVRHCQPVVRQRWVLRYQQAAPPPAVTTQQEAQRRVHSCQSPEPQRSALRRLWAPWRQAEPCSPVATPQQATRQQAQPCLPVPARLQAARLLSAVTMLHAEQRCQSAWQRQQPCQLVQPQRLAQRWLQAAPRPASATQQASATRQQAKRHRPSSFWAVGQQHSAQH